MSFHVQPVHHCLLDGLLSAFIYFVLVLQPVANVVLQDLGSAFQVQVLSAQEPASYVFLNDLDVFLVGLLLLLAVLVHVLVQQIEVEVIRVFRPFLFVPGELTATVVETLAKRETSHYSDKAQYTGQANSCCGRCSLV